MENKTIFCENCGERLPAGSKFCNKCGAKVPRYVQSMAESAGFDASDSAQSDPGSSATEKEDKPKGFRSAIKWIILAAVVVVVALLLVFFVMSPGSIKLDSYISFESVGSDGYGSVTCTFDEDAFFRDYRDQVDLADSSLEKEYSWLDGADDAVKMLYYECIDWEVDYPGAGNGSLSNGDTVSLKWRCRDSAAKKYFNAKLQYSDLTYEVSGLGSAKAIDIFDYIDVVVTGADPLGEATIESYGEEMGIFSWDFTLSESEGLRNGDQITVRYDENAVSGLIQDYGITPTDLEEDFAVTGLPSYITQVSDIPADTMNVLRSITESGIRTEEDLFIDGITLSSLNYEGCYLAYEDPDASSGSYSTEVYVVYAVNVHEQLPQYNLNDIYTYYSYAEFYDLILMPDGTCEFDADDYYVCGNSFIRQYGASEREGAAYDGYESTAQLLSALESDGKPYDTNIIASAAVPAVPADTEEDTGEDTGEVTADGEYLCSYSSERLITDADLAALRAIDYGTMPGGRGLEQMLINEIYARHGYQFTDQEVQRYFEQKAWYNAIGTYSNDMDYIMSQMTDIEKQNVNYLSTFL